MAMNYATLVGPKGTAGAIADWTGYGKLQAQADTILTEAQSLIYQSLRVREMRSSFTFGMPVNSCRVALPPRFLDPIGRLVDTSFGVKYRHFTESDVLERRSFSQLGGGAVPNNAFTTGAANSSLVTVALANSTITQGSDITISGATAVLDGIGLNGTFLVTAADAASVTFQTGDTATAGGVTGGGAAAVWSASQLIAGSPTCWAMWDEYLQFDQAFDTATSFRLMCFKSPAPLAVNNPSNFLCTRYPLLLRKACQAAAADFMKDDAEYQKATGALAALIQATNAESDLMYRGADLYMEVP